MCLSCVWSHQFASELGGVGLHLIADISHCMTPHMLHFRIQFVLRFFAMAQSGATFTQTPEAPEFEMRVEELSLNVTDTSVSKELWS